MRYSDAELQFLRDNRDSMTIPVLTKKLNERFNKERSENAVGTKCRKMRLIVGNKNQQHRGWVSWTSGLTAAEIKNHYKDEGSFKKGKFRTGKRSTAYKYGVGDTVVRGEYVFIKTTDDISVVPERQWMPKHRWVWEQEYGPIPDGYRVMFLDGDHDNMDISNLVAIPVELQGRVKAYKDPQLTLLAIEAAKLDLAIKEVRQELHED